MISGWQLLVVLVIVIVIFGTKRLRNIGTDLGGAIKGFRSAVKDGDEERAKIDKKDNEESVIEGEVTNKEKNKV